MIIDAKHLGRGSTRIDGFPYPLGPNIGDHILVIPSGISTKPIQKWKTFPLWNVLCYESMYFPRPIDDYFRIFYTVETEKGQKEDQESFQLPNERVYLIEDQILRYSSGMIQDVPTAYYRSTT